MQKYMDDENLMPKKKTERVLQWIKKMQRSAADFKSNTTRM